MYQREFCPPTCLFGTVIETTYQQTTDNKIREVRQTDSDIKKERKSTYNSSKRTVDMNYKIGDQVLLRNYKKKSKLDPDYLPEKFVIMEVLAKGEKREQYFLDL